MIRISNNMIEWQALRVLWTFSTGQTARSVSPLLKTDEIGIGGGL